MTSIRKTDGKWSKEEMGLYFLALFNTAAPKRFSTMPYQKKICALTEFGLLKQQKEHNKTPAEAAIEWAEIYRHLFIDSGVFSLANAEAIRKKVSFEEGLKLKLSDIEGGEEYLADYINTCQQIKNVVWGYIEVDLGGRDEKIKTRERLHAAGLSPVPVYHPLLDGADYLEYLCKRYDRICVSNLVQSNSETRSILTAFVYNFIMQLPKESRPYVHYLGVSPSQSAFAHNCLGSCDSSSWARGRRYGVEMVMTFSQIVPFQSVEGENPFAPTVGNNKQHYLCQHFEMNNFGIHGYENYYEEVHRSHMAI